MDNTTNTTYLREINGEIERYQNKRVQVVPGLNYNQRETLNRIYFFYNSKFETGDIDDEGDRKYFYNIVRNPCKIYSKAIDFDTKNIRLLTTESGDSLKTWFMERDLKYWMRKEQFGKVLNRIFKEIPIFGSVVLKIIEGKPYFVDLRNFIVDQSANSLDESNYIIEIHRFTPGKFRAAAKKMGWRNVDKVLDEFYRMKDESHIRVYERYGELKVGENYEWRRYFIADVGTDIFNEQNGETIKYPGVELSSEKYDGHPYWEFHGDKIPGRWLGVGVVEELFEPQIAQNVNTNLQAKSSYWAALRLFQTRDGAINRNSINDARNGEVLNSDSEITQIDMSDRNLAFFREQDNRWMRNRDEMVLSYDVIQGERLPAGTPLGSAQIAMTQTLAFFELIQENIALDIKEMLYEVIIPRFQKENNAEHTLRIIGKDLDTFYEMIKGQLELQEMIKQISNGAVPTPEMKETISVAVRALMKENEQLLKIPKDFYKDVKYDVEIDITGESVDTRVKNATMFALLQAITSDPTMLKDPTKKKFLYTLAENGGINPNEYFGSLQQENPELEMMQAGMQGGGGVSAPAFNMGGQMPTTVA